MGHPTLTRDEVFEIRKAYEELHSIKLVTARTGHSATTVRKYLRVPLPAKEQSHPAQGNVDPAKAAGAKAEVPLRHLSIQALELHFEELGEVTCKLRDQLVLPDRGWFCTKENVPPPETIGRLAIENELLFDCLKEHLAGTSILSELEAWRRGVQAYRHKCEQLYEDIRQKCREKTGLDKIVPVLEDQGIFLLENFPRTVYLGAFDIARGAEDAASQPLQQKVDQRTGLGSLWWGSCMLAQASPDSLHKLGLAHASLRVEFSGSSQMREILGEEGDPSGIHPEGHPLAEATRRLREGLELLIGKRVFPGTCRVCKELFA